jgi:hypothetical protein
MGTIHQIHKPRQDQDRRDYTVSNQSSQLCRSATIVCRSGTVEYSGRKKLYSNRQLERTKAARELLDAVGAPSLTDRKAGIRSNQIKDNPVTIGDVILAEKIFGPDVTILRGKATRTQPTPMRHDIVKIPQELGMAQEQVTLCIDRMWVNGFLFLTTISEHIMYRTAHHVPRRTTEVYKTLLKQVCCIYNAVGFLVKFVHGNNGFRPLIEVLEDELGVKMQFAPPQGHVSEAERNNRTIKERVRVTYHCSHFNRIPQVMMTTAVLQLAATLNFFPPRGGCSNYNSPRTILHQETLDYKAHCQFGMWSYVLATNDAPNTKRTNAPRVLDCIYLRPIVEGCVTMHELFHIQTGQIIKR